MAEDRRTPDPGARERELDAQVEELTHRIAEVVKSAGAESRDDLREYAIGLLKEETEREDETPATTSGTPATKFSPLAFAILLGLVGLPLVLLFAPLGLGLVGVAVLMGIWGIVDTFIRR